MWSQENSEYEANPGKVREDLSQKQNAKQKCQSRGSVVECLPSNQKEDIKKNMPTRSLGWLVFPEYHLTYKLYSNFSIDL
jgi:hypothetical protein